MLYKEAKISNELTTYITQSTVTSLPDSHCTLSPSLSLSCQLPALCDCGSSAETEVDGPMFATAKYILLVSVWDGAFSSHDTSIT